MLNLKAILSVLLVGLFMVSGHGVAHAQQDGSPEGYIKKFGRLANLHGDPRDCRFYKDNPFSSGLNYDAEVFIRSVFDCNGTVYYVVRIAFSSEVVVVEQSSVVKYW